MTLKTMMRGIQRLFLDTAPIVYYIEEHPHYCNRVTPIFQNIDTGVYTAVTSPITLSECLVIPFRLHQVALQQEYVSIITQGLFTDFHHLEEADAHLAARLRAKYRIALPDALQIAAALNAQCDAILTNDLDLKRISEIRVLIVDELPG